jgi:alpha-D-ribose 1-methylphosphonate 5-phosphate C-P lyase
MLAREWVGRRERPAASLGHSFGFLDEGTKREVRRAILKAVAIPGYQVPFGSRELPIQQGKWVRSTRR